MLHGERATAGARRAYVDAIEQAHRQHWIAGMPLRAPTIRARQRAQPRRTCPHERGGVELARTSDTDRVRISQRAIDEVVARLVEDGALTCAVAAYPPGGATRHHGCAGIGLEFVETLGAADDQNEDRDASDADHGRLVPRLRPVVPLATHGARPTCVPSTRVVSTVGTPMAKAIAPPTPKVHAQAL